MNTEIDEENKYSDDPVSPTAETITAELLTKCRTLLQEIGQFEAYLKQHGKEKTADLRAFKNNLQAELKSLQKKDATIHNLRSSNLPFHTAVWDTAKSSCGVVAFNQRFNLKNNKAPNSGTEKQGNELESKRAGSYQRSSGNGQVIVDIVTEGGAEWVKVSTITELRLIYEMTKNGWEFGQDEEYGSSDSNNTDDREEHDNDEDDTALHLQKLAKDLQQAATGVRIRYKHPKIRFVLPKIKLGVTRDIDRLINSIRSTGVVVQCANEITSPSPLEQAIPRMIYNEFATCTPTVNIDCTLLLALVSDLSHGPVSIQSSQPLAIRRQIQREETDQLLPTSLWPAMADRELVCTSHAARRMREIVDLIGTPGEKARTALVMSDDKDVGTRESLLEEFQKYSSHCVPKEWQIPIRVIQEDELDPLLQILPDVAKVVSEKLSDINRSVFFYGWAKGITTLTSNKTVVRMIEKLIEDSGSDIGPHIWLCHTARSLLGKEKKKIRGENKKLDE